MHLVVTCTQRKTLVAPAELQVGSLQGESTAARAVEWRSRLGAYDGEHREARSLYAGDSWKVSRELEQVAQNVCVWVCSAGYGLVPLEAELAPYAATFAPGQADSIASVGGQGGWQQCREWWATITQGDGMAAGAAPSFRALAERGEPVVFTGSESYVRSVGPDLRAAAARLQDRLILISAGTGENVLLENDLVQHAVPCSARFQATLGGSRQSLNVRILKTLLDEDVESWSAPAVAALLAERAADLPELPTYDRTPAKDDEEIREWIRDALKDRRRPAHSPLLREYRDSGKRCEQKRFRSLFQEVMAAEQPTNDQHA